MTRLEVLRAARALIADPSRHATDYFARDKHGVPVAPYDPRACAWCANGAFMHVRATKSAKIGDAWESLRRACHELYGIEGVAEVNDTPGGHTKILAAFDRAIAKEESAT